MIRRTLVKNALNAKEPEEEIRIEGWVRTRRDAKAFSFVEINVFLYYYGMKFETM